MFFLDACDDESTDGAQSIGEIFRLQFEDFSC